MQTQEKRSLMFIPALIIFVLGSMASLSDSKFFFQADGSMSRRTAVQLGLMTEQEAPFSGGLVFKKGQAGGYEYRDRSVMLSFAPTRHTNIDLASECEHFGGCEWRK